MAWALISTSAWGQITINSSPNPVGSGARALGMGGAFIGLADDATAASWNPGGLTQLEVPEVSLVYSWKWYEEEFHSVPHPELEGTHDMDIDDINYASIAYPIPRTIAGRNFVVSLNYQHKFDFDRALDLQFRDITPLATGNIFSRRIRVNYRQEGRLAALSPAFGFEVTDKLSLGIVWNIWDESLVPGNEWKIRNRFKTFSMLNGGAPTITWGEINEDYTNFRGDNFTIGMLYHITPRLRVGAVYHTKFASDVDYKRTFRLRGPVAALAISREDRRIEWPSAFGLGASYRFPNDKLTISLDVTRREWDEYVEIDRAGRRTSPVTGLRKFMSFHEPTYTVRAGAEYVFVDPKQPLQSLLPSLRAGLFSDPAPSGNRKDTPWTLSLGRGDGEPDDYYGITLGGGLLIKNRVNIDAAYQYRWGEGVRSDTFGFFKTDADVDQHEFFLSTVIYF